MTRAVLLFCVLIGAAPAGASGLPEFEAPLAELRAAVRSQPLALGGALKARPRPAPKGPERVSDPETWARMLERARRNPTLTQDLRVGDTDYKVFVAVSESVVPGQECAAGFQPRNALYVSQAVSGPGNAVYPVRLVSDCVGPALTLQLFALDADAAGFIADSALYDPAKGKPLDPSRDRLSPAQVDRFYAYLTGMVRLFAGGQ
ncbi:MAG: hypothetical protein NTY77_10165 [Elusimicrobia bacterium]|nr:hypothetical protein [Elusimicrobiota bacterium]